MEMGKRFDRNSMCNKKSEDMDFGQETRIRYYCEDILEKPPETV